MARVTILYWRDIPAQVIAETGKGRQRTQAKIELDRRFAIAIDEAAMRDGAASSDAYLEDWRKGTPQECSDDLETEARALAETLDARFSRAELAQLVANGGRAMS